VVRLATKRNHSTAESQVRRLFTALAGRISELYAQGGTAQEPGGAPE
jgi:hypothetical protein